MPTALCCSLEEKFLNEFLIILNSKEIKDKSEKKQFNLARIYSHILMCTEHHEAFDNYINTLINANKITEFANKNILYLSQYLHGNENLRSN